MLRFLVTGGCGFIGRSVVEMLLAQGAKYVRVVDNLSAGSAETLSRIGALEQISQPNFGPPQASIQLLVGDIRDANLAMAACQDIDVIIHLAANTGVAPSLVNPRDDCLANVIGTLNYLEGARGAGVRRFVFASSGATIGECTPPIHEELPSRPVSPYGASKLAGEAYCSAYTRSFGISTVALRFGNVYGPGFEHKESVVARFIRRAFAQKPLQIYGDGRQTRDFVYIDDLVQAIKCAAEVEHVGGEVFQIATSRETTIAELVVTLHDVLVSEGFPPPGIENLDPRAGDVLRNFADTSKAQSKLGWSATVTLKDGLTKTVRWASTHFGRDNK